ncbi:MAG: SSI family serine proteinase inhibitor [Micromonosporaceae bacterium]
MLRSVRKTIISGAAVAVCVLALGGGVPAVADVVRPGAPVPTTDRDADPFRFGLPGLVDPEAGDSMALTVRSEISDSRQVTLTCRPAGGNHPAPHKACGQLNAAGGDISKIPAEAGVCTAEYAPVTVVASGAWDGVERSYQREFGNRCQAVRTTGGVLFDF